MDVSCFDKVIIAFFEDDNYHRVLRELSSKGFYSRVLHSEGGIFRKPKSTILIGVNHNNLDNALELLKEHGSRVINEYKPLCLGNDHCFPYFSADAMEIPTIHGGVEAFVFDIGQCKKY